MKKLLTLALCGCTFLAIAQKQTYLLVGAYTGGKSKGISVYHFDTKTGSAKLTSSASTENPSYLAVSPDQKFVYAVNELGNSKGGGKVSAFAFDGGELHFLNQQASQGEDPCYITESQNRKWVIVGNYSSGTVTVLPVQKEGLLGEAATVVQHHGSGVHPRQEKPHVHSTVLSADNRFLYVPDLGIDKVMIYAFNDQTGTLSPKDTSLKLVPGSGPRHFVFHPNNKWAYLVQELKGTVTVFHSANGDLQPVQTISVLPPGFQKPFTGADIHVAGDGRFLYASLRDSSNTIAICRIAPGDGKLSLLGHQSTLGKTPRNFNLDPTGNFLLAANQNSDSIVVFRVDKKTGALHDTGQRISVGNPVCIKWITAPQTH